MEAEEPLKCGGVSRPHSQTGLRVAAIFVILVTSTFGALFPVVARRVDRLHVPAIVFDFFRYFGSGVIIATGFIHLLAPGLEALGSECLTGTWTVYPWALAIAMSSVFGIFLIELFAHRIGTDYLNKLSMGDEHQPHATKSDEELELSPDEKARTPSEPSEEVNNLDMIAQNMSRSEASARIVGVGILELGVVVHSVIIGLTLAVTEEFTTLFIVITFHQTFEAIGLGSRLAFLPLPKSMNWVAIFGGLLYAIMTPLGIAIGLGVRSTYNPEGTTASIVAGVLDSLSAGILIYTGLVELLARDFIFEKAMHKAPLPKLLFNLGSILLGAGLMSLLGRWA